MKKHPSKEKFPTSRLDTILEQRRKQGWSEEQLERLKKAWSKA